jgi:Zn-dependent protease with chaperone function
MTETITQGGRITLPGLSSRAYEHPADRSALVALRAVPGFDTVLKALSGLIRERSHRLTYLASSIRVSERQFVDIHAMYVELVTILDLPEAPELYIQRSAEVNAVAMGMDKPFIVVTTGLLDLMDPDELRFVLAHELGHVLSGHALYRSMLYHVVRLSARAVWFTIGYLGLRAVIAALEEWARKSELSADRAGLLGCQDPNAGLRALMKLAGGARLYAMDPAAFLEQAAEYDASGDLRDGVLKLLNLEGQRHPFTVLRAAELQRWVDDGDLATILGGSYPLRVDDPRVSFTDEVKASAQSYKRGIDESADPLIKLVRSAGGEAFNLGGRLLAKMSTPRPAGGDDTKDGTQN